MKIDRRHFLKVSAGSAATVALPFSVSMSSLASVVKIGSASLSTVSDGNLVLPGNFMVPPDFPAEQFDTFVKENSLPTDSYEPACNVCLWQHDDHVVLFDVGAGSNFMPSTGKLLESLEEIDTDPADVTDVVLTHAHPDHVWGLIDDFDELAFPEANYYMNSREWDYWSDPNTIETLPESRKTFAVGAQNRMAYIEDRVKLFNYGDEIISGIEAVDTSGHTVGHTSFALHNGSESIMVLGDAITHPIISFQKPDWPGGGDQDQAGAIASRKKLLDRMAVEKMKVLGFHLPHPGVGYAERKDSAYRFVTN